MHRLKLIFTFSLTLTIGHLYSQGLEIELSGGPTLTSLRGNDDIENNYDHTNNFSTGLGINYLFKGNSIIDIKLLYDKKGAMGESYIVLRDEQNQVIGEGVVTNKSTFDYITMPIQWGQRFGQKVKYQFGVGLYAGFLIKQEQTGEGLNGLVNSNEDNTDNFKKFDFGLSASFSVLFPIKESFLIKMGLEDNLGLVNASDVPVKNDGTIKHNSLGLSIGLIFKVN